MSKPEANLGGRRIKYSQSSELRVRGVERPRVIMPPPCPNAPRAIPMLLR
jgi:hypothetical protein